MTRCRRGLVLVALTLAGVLGLTTVASAAFDDSATTGPVSIGTATVEPVTELSTAGTHCTYSTYYTWWGSYTTVRSLNARISWTASTTAGVSGYRVTAVFPDGSTYEVATVGPGTTRLDQDVDGSYADQRIRVRITTLTSYGWASAPVQTGTLRC